MATDVLMAPKASRARPLLRAVLVALVLAALVAHLVAAWVFSDWIRDHALMIPSVERVADGAVLEVDGDRVTIRALEEADDDIAAAGVAGFEYGGGFLRLGEVVAESGRDVTRTFQLIEGALPAAGAEGTIEANPSDSEMLSEDLGVVASSYQGPLGTMSAWMIAGSSTWVIHVPDRRHGPDQALRAMSVLAPEGLTQFVIGYRNGPDEPHDESERSAYGVTERDDLAAAVEHAISAGASNVILMGYGSGASIVLAETYRSRDVTAVVLDGPILDAGSAVGHQADSADGIVASLPFTMRAAGLVAATMRFGISWNTTDYLSRAEALSVPVLLIHGTEDRVSPIEDSRTLAAERGDVVTLLEVEGAGSDRTWNVDPTAYGTALLGFLDRVRSGG